MNPVLPQQRHNNSFLLPQHQSQGTSSQPTTTTNSQYRNLFPNLSTYGILIPPDSGIARVAMGNSSSCTDIHNQRPTMHSMDTSTRVPPQRRQPEKPARSNLSALLDQQQQQREFSTSNEEQSYQVQDEADLASGPLQGNLQPTTGVPHLPQHTPPPTIPNDLRHMASAAETGHAPHTPASNDSIAKPKTRRCMSSKELDTLAPPSGSPYAFMLYQKDMIASRMAERLKQTREGCSPSHSSSPLTVPDDSSSSSQRGGARMANEARNKRRAEHNRAVTNDLCEIVTDLFIAESKLLNPSKYGVDSTNQKEQVLRSVERFVGSLPPRYALGIDSPSLVLLHMRLCAAARSDRPTVHIMNLENDKHWTNPSTKNGRSRRLVTIACGDTTGLLEYVTKLLATGGSRVLDADVMLSNDNIALDRFVVEMHGRLRLDKLATCIERFLEEARVEKEKKSTTAVPDTVSSSSVSVDSKSMSEFAGTVYYRAIPETNEAPTPREMQQAIDAAVPLTEMLASGNGNSTVLPMLGGNFRPLSRHLSLPRTLPSAVRRMPVEPDKLSSSASMGRRSESMPVASPEQKGGTDPKPCSMRQRRPLVNRQGNSDLDRIGDDETDDGDDGNLAVDFLTLDVSGDGYGNRKVPLIPFDELMLIETLGMGRVSTIYRAVWRHLTANQTPAPEGAHMVALKVAMMSTVALDTSHVDELRREADIAARLQHPNICDLIGVAADAECFCLAYEFCEGGSLLSLLSDTTRYYEYLPIALDIANGMAYLHSRNVIHRDLKPSNILLTRDHRAMIADFGMSVANTGQELTAETGTYRYMAPEVIRHESYSSNADVYSFGICLWQLITREVPFATMTPIQAAYAVAEGRRPPIPDSTPRRLREIVSACWDQDSHKRPSFTYIAMALADYAKMAFSPANVGAQTLQIANEMLANVEGNSTVNVDFSAPVLMGAYMHSELSQGSNLGLEI